MDHFRWFEQVRVLFSNGTFIAAENEQGYQSQLDRFVEESALPCPNFTELADLFFADTHDDALNEIISDNLVLYLNYCWVWFVKLLRQQGEVRLQLPLSLKEHGFIRDLVNNLKINYPFYTDFCLVVKAVLGEGLNETNLNGYFPELKFFSDPEARKREIQRYERTRKVIYSKKIVQLKLISP